MGAAVIFVITIASAVTSLIYTGPGDAPSGVSADHRIYPGDRGFGTVCGNVSEKEQPVSVQCTWRLSAADHDKLCRTWCGTDQCTEKLRHRRERGKWPGNGGRIYDRDRADGRYP